ncbi:MAG: protease SohB [Arenicellales bacterium]
MEFVTDYGLFLAKSATIVIAILVVVGSIASIAIRQKKAAESEIQITLLNKEYEHMETILDSALLGPEAQKQWAKSERKKQKQIAKQEKKAKKKGHETEHRKRLFVIDFHGDIRASATEAMRHEISAILTNATEKDEVMVRLESGGGVVHGYGLAASQLQRIRDHGIPLTISVDKVAASGGYMMACVANHIIAAPFSIVGSIGVLAQIPNVHRLLKKNEVDFEQLSAGEYKRTLTVFGENTDKARKKLQQELEETHQHFKDFIKSQRPDLYIDQVATGEHWLGTKALELGLVDRLQTSDDYLMESRKDSDMIHLEYVRKKKISERIASIFSSTLNAKEESLRDLEKPMLM